MTHFDPAMNMDKAEEIQANRRAAEEGIDLIRRFSLKLLTQSSDELCSEIQANQEDYMNMAENLEKIITYLHAELDLIENAHGRLSMLLKPDQTDS